MKPTSELTALNKPLFQKKMTKLKIERHFTSEDDRNIKKHRRRQLPYKKTQDDKLTINGYSISEEINLKVKFTLMESTFKFQSEEECHIYFDGASIKFLFVFDFGVVVFWNFKDSEEKLLLRKMEKIMVNKFASDDVEKDTMYFSINTDENSKIDDKTIYLTTDELEEKFAHSYAFAQYLKLMIFESKVERTIFDTEEIPKNLAKSGEIDLSQKKVYQMIGNIFILRSSVNLLSGMLDTPDCFSQQDRWENIYLQAYSYYEVEERVKIINDRLDLIKELYDMLNDDLHNKHTANLEWIVISLILIEVFVEIFWNILIRDIFKLV